MYPQNQKKPGTVECRGSKSERNPRARYSKKQICVFSHNVHTMTDTKSLEELQSEYRTAEQQADALEVKVRANATLRYIKKAGVDDLVKIGYQILAAAPSEPALPLEEAIRQTDLAREGYYDALERKNKVGFVLARNPDDRTVVNEKAVWIGPSIYESYPAQVDVIYLDTNTNTKKEERWSLPTLAKWHKDRNLLVPGVCFIYGDHEEADTDDDAEY